MRKRTALALLAFILVAMLCAPVALAQNSKRANMRDYTPSNQSQGSAPVDKRAMARGGSQLKDFGSSGKRVEKKGDPMVPIYALGLVLFLVGGCTPFAMKLIKENNKRLADEASFGRNPEGVGEPVSRGASPRRKDAGGNPGSGLAKLDDAVGEEDKPSVPLASPEEVHEKVWYTLGDAGKWLSAEGVARLAKLDVEQCREELKMLAEDGHIDESKDRTGRPIYKAREA